MLIGPRHGTGSVVLVPDFVSQPVGWPVTGRLLFFKFLAIFTKIFEFWAILVSVGMPNLARRAAFVLPGCAGDRFAACGPARHDTNGNCA